MSVWRIVQRPAHWYDYRLPGISLEVQQPSLKKATISLTSWRREFIKGSTWSYVRLSYSFQLTWSLANYVDWACHPPHWRGFVPTSISHILWLTHLEGYQIPIGVAVLKRRCRPDVLHLQKEVHGVVWGCRYLTKVKCFVGMTSLWCSEIQQATKIDARIRCFRQ